MLLKLIYVMMLNLSDMHDINLIPVYLPTHLNVEADYLSWRRVVLEWHLLPSRAQATFQLLGQPEVDLLASSCSHQCQHYYTFEN